MQKRIGCPREDGGQHFLREKRIPKGGNLCGQRKSTCRKKRHEQEKREKKPKVVLHLTRECFAKNPFETCKYPNENGKEQI